MQMDQAPKEQQSFNILCDRVFYQRLQDAQQNELMKISMFPVRNSTNKSLNFVMLDLVKQKNAQGSKQFNQEEFIKICQDMKDGLQILQMLTYLIPKQTIQQFVNDKHKMIKILCSENVRQLNQLMRQFVIVTLNLPSQFYYQKDCNYSLEGYKFNPIGKVTQTWSYLSNGRILKAIFAKQNQKIKTLLRQNVMYSKNELKHILETIKNVNNISQCKQEQKSKLLEDLRVLGQNYCHSQKFVTASNGLIPILNFQVEVLCSIARGENCQNLLAKQAAKDCSKVSHKVCINFAESLQSCQDIIKKKIEQIFTADKTVLSRQLQQSPSFTTLTTIPTKISNPHLFLKTQSKDKFQQFYVKGFYEYYHYGDHNFNDQGWGCAYRSLETLLSWFKLQQKLQLLAIPTVSEIQNLVDIIDCTSQQKISNTNTWIGATEVSWVVKKLTGFDCRIIHIQDGKDIVEHAQIFRDHLQNVGTPIMYGGGEYAYSIVGINYSWKLGEIMFLILDPHYSGSDKIQKIIEKKGICWRKPQEMFKKGVFYNFCLPIL